MFDRWTGIAALADEVGFVLALPSALGDIWNDGRYRGPEWARIEGVDDVGYLRTLIDDACARLPIDPRRIYVVGMSNGATMAARFACEHAERIAALAQIAGTAAVQVASLPPDCPCADPPDPRHGRLDGAVCRRTRQRTSRAPVSPPSG
jgi:polyhydroxybutyrate depolymerase